MGQWQPGPRGCRPLWPGPADPVTPPSSATPRPRCSSTRPDTHPAHGLCLLCSHCLAHFLSTPNLHLVTSSSRPQFEYNLSSERPDHPETRPGSSSMLPPAPCLLPCPDCLGEVPDHFSCARGLPCLTPCPTSRTTVRRNWESALEFTRQENATAQGSSLAPWPNSI